jgi:ankyrin repeat protein
MSGEDLRDAVIHNRVDVLRQFILEKTNPCSGDEYGLNALHYAVWNGHAECVRLLAMNPNGVDANGKRNSCLITQSCMGYTGKPTFNVVYCDPYFRSH